MKHRTTILLDQEIYERVRARAKRHDTTVSDEVRAILAREFAEENPNQWLLDMAGMITDVLPGPSIDSDEFKEQMARDIYRDAMNREPDW